MRRRRSFALFSIIGLVFTAGCKDSTGPAKAGAPVDIRASAGDAQTGRAGAVLLAPIAVKVTDAKGRGVGNIEVTFQAMPASGSVTPNTARTNGAGIATTSWTMPTTAGGTATVRAVFVDTLSGALVDSVTFSAKVIGGLPAYMQVMTSPSRGATRATVGPIRVVLYDAWGNRSPGVVVNWSATGGAAPSAPTSVSDSNGVASIFATLGATAGSNTVTASTGILSATMYIEVKVPGEPATLQQNFFSSDGASGSTVPLSVRVLDGLDAGVAGKTVTWTRTSGDGTLSAATSVTNADGVAATTLTLGSIGGLTQVEATLGSLRALFRVEAKNIAPRLAYLAGGGFGIDRTSAGRFVTAEIQSGLVQVFPQSSPGSLTTINVGGVPVVVAVDPAGDFAYVSNMNGWVDVISLATNTVVKQVAVPGAHSLAMSPGGDKVYVASYEGHVHAISTTTRAITASVDIPNGPWGIAFRTSGTDSLMYVTTRDGGTISEVDTKTMSVRRTFFIGGRLHGLVISPDGQFLYAADNAQGLIQRVSTSSGTSTGTVSLSGSFGIAISPDGTTLFATTDYAKAAVINSSTLAITKLYETGNSGRQLVVSPDGMMAWAANQGGWIDIIAK